MNRRTNPPPDNMRHDLQKLSPPDLHLPTISISLLSLLSHLISDRKTLTPLAGFSSASSSKAWRASCSRSRAESSKAAQSLVVKLF